MCGDKLLYVNYLAGNPPDMRRKAAVNRRLTTWRADWATTEVRFETVVSKISRLENDFDEV